MREYILTTGPLSSFDYLYDPRMMDRMADYPVIAVAPQAMPDARFADCRRDAKIETAFLQALVLSFPPGGRTFGGFVDVGSGRAGALAEVLRKSPLVSTDLKYGIAEDRAVLCEVPTPVTDLSRIWAHYPPSHGIVFFYVANTIFDVVEIFWHRKAADPKRQADRLKRDAIEFTAYSKAVVLVDEEGAFHAIALPAFVDAATLERMVQEAGRRAGLRITTAPGLFG